MAGKKRVLFRLLSSAGTGYFYVGSKPTMYHPSYAATHSKNYPCASTTHSSTNMSSSMRSRCLPARKERDPLLISLKLTTRLSKSTHCIPSA